MTVGGLQPRSEVGRHQPGHNTFKEEGERTKVSLRTARTSRTDQWQSAYREPRLGEHIGAPANQSLMQDRLRGVATLDYLLFIVDQSHPCLCSCYVVVTKSRV